MIDTVMTTQVGQGSTADHGSDTYSPSIVDVTLNESVFGIRAADVDEQRNSASMLISKMYAWRGYGGNHQVGRDPNRITLTASTKGEVLGTLSLNLDSEVGLLSDQVFKDCIDPYRAKGARVCELIKLAIDPGVKSKAVLASLFHVALIYARDLHNCSEIFIEVNPRHRRFYEAMLDFVVECESRPNPRVDAPAVLLRGNTAVGTRRIAEVAGQGDHAVGDRSLFPYFFSPREEAGIIARLKRIG
ncbi:N-acetyltransferase [Massilia sp. G4R7]|uniref:N-acetyltransferase n=1 Tax=Massilia phyllostachyos TaxID=2898585 RepID=A0ABS8QC82_9BURK|nr:GNAT family N-acetyltransferase [Massilia phyllostachyos]MCD2519366.1 N-acetyltransferase [Massilia phyllostachyos]